MDEIGIVTRIEGPIAIVTVARKSACDQCKAGCKLSESGAEIEALNRVQARAGQRVRVALKPSAYLTGSLLVYGLPALSLIVGAVLGKELMTTLFRTIDPDILSAICGFGAFGLSFLLVNVWSRRAGRRTENKPVVEEILAEDG